MTDIDRIRSAQLADAIAIGAAEATIGLAGTMTPTDPMAAQLVLAMATAVMDDTGHRLDAGAGELAMMERKATAAKVQ